MIVDLTASRDACQPASCSQKDDILLDIQRRQAQRARIGTKGAQALRRLSGVGLGICLTIATAGAVAEPAAANSTLAAESTSHNASPSAEGKLASLPGTDAVTTGISLSRTDASGSDPLEKIVPVQAAELGDLRASIISSISLVSPSAESGTDEDEEAEPRGQDYLRFDKMRVPRWIVDAVLRASEVTGVDPVYMMALADKESSFIPDNKASSSSAQGLYQFIESTWIEVVRAFGAQHGLTAEAAAIKVVDGQLTVPDDAMRKHILGLRRNPYISTLMAAEMKKRDRTRIEEKIGRKISRSEYYLPHFFGVDGAGKFISLVDGKPKQSAPRVFPGAARANRALFYAKKGRKTRQLTVSEVYDKIDEMIDKRLARYEDVSAVAVAGADL